MRRRNFPSFFLSYQRSNVINEARERASTNYHPATHCFESTTIEESYYYAGIKKITPPNKALSIRETSVLNKKKLETKEYGANVYMQPKVCFFWGGKMSR